MRMEIVTKNFEVSDKLRDILDRKIQKLDKYFDEDTKVKMTLKQEKEVCKMEIMLTFHGSFIRSEVTGDDMFENIDVLLPKVEGQIRKHKTKLKNKLKESAPIPAALTPEEEEDVAIIAKLKTFRVDPMSVEEAAAALDMIGHDFFLYKDSETTNLTVIYKRADGTYGLLIPQ